MSGNATRQPPRLRNAAGLWFELLDHGGLRRAGREEDVLGLFVGHEAQTSFSNLWLRLPGSEGTSLLPLLGPGTVGRWTVIDEREARFEAAADGSEGAWRWCVCLRLASSCAAWFWHVELCNAGSEARVVEPAWVQDVGLTSYGALRLNEHYVSQYVDLQPLRHATCGTVIAARQNQPVQGRHPWLVAGGLQAVVAWATDARQVHGLDARDGAVAEGLRRGLPSRRLQHEHACIALQGQGTKVEPGQRVMFGWFGRVESDHPEASGAGDLLLVDATLALPEAAWPVSLSPGAQRTGAVCAGGSASLFVTAPWLDALALQDEALISLFGPDRLHEERGPEGELWSAFSADGRHLVLPAKERVVLRPHGHLLRGGSALVPDEGALTSTVWMCGVFHSMLTQGHVSINRLLSTVHGYLGLDRSSGLRVFLDAGSGWRQLGMPSAFQMAERQARWVYRHTGGVLEVCSVAGDDAMEFAVRVLEGPSVRLRLTLHVALAGDDGSQPGGPLIALEPGPGGQGVRELRLSAPAGSALAQRFPQGDFLLQAQTAGGFSAVGGDEALFCDGVSRGEPFVCLDAVAEPAFEMRITGRLVNGPRPSASAPLPELSWSALQSRCEGAVADRLSAIVPWFRHNALIHYLAPRGLEQYSGGGWGTRDVCQGPLEALLALGRCAPVRDLLCRTFAAQNADGDWPQWFMFFERERAIRAGDSHGDIVFWPLLALGRYLVASADGSLLDERLPFFGCTESVPVSTHVERALRLIEARLIPGTALAAYGHGDWNDSLQPADPTLRENLCSAWTVTLHHQMLTALAQGLARAGRVGVVDDLRARAQRVREDFRRLLMCDGIVTGYALFAQNPSAPELLLHPRDRRTGLRFSLLPMMHAVLEDLLEPAEATEHLRLIREHLVAPDGARLFDAPLAYQGGPQRLFQRAESSSYFGREIGVMYVHAHLRYAQTLAHVGDGEGFVDALARINPIGLSQVVPSAAPRQANAYFSSSDAAFDDRREASRDYARVRSGDVPVEAGWRVYSSGPGIFLHLVARHLVGVVEEAGDLVFDPVLHVGLDGLCARATVLGRDLRISHRVGPKGCGPLSISCEGRLLPFTREPHRHRLGAARVGSAAWRACLAGIPADVPVRIEVHTA